ncbi:MAG: S9 family peptidase [Pyrinomonadaceae bacterium]
MKLKHLVASLVLWIMAVSALVAQPPAVIDREILFGNPEIAGASISPDGKYIMFRKPYKGVMNIHVKRSNEPFDTARLITNRSGVDRPIAGAFWSRDSKYILYSADQGGDENFNVYAVNPMEEAKAGAEVPIARNITEAKGVRVQIMGVPENDPDVIFVGINERDKAWHDLYKVKLSTGERTLVKENKDRIAGYVFDTTDKMRLAVRTPPNGDTEILRLDTDGAAKVLYTCNLFESCGPVRFNKDNKRVYLTTNKGDADLTRLTLLDVESGKEEMVESDPLGRVDLDGAAFSDLTDEIISTSYTDDRTKLYWKDKKYEADYKFLQSRYPGKEIGLGSRTADEQLMLVSVSSDTDPGETFLFDRKKRTLTSQYKIRSKIDRASLSTVRTVRYKSSDGLEIPAYLTLPKGIAAKNLPLVVFPHGGPWARDYWGYNSWAQFLANRGYAVLQPNFRASTGYGKKFLNAGNNEWGQKMQDDITWGVKHLVAEGLADPKRIGIMGISYGGYATLAGVAFTPDLYSAAVAIVAPSNTVTLLEAIPPYWEAGRTLMYRRMGDPNTASGKAQMMSQSPVNSIDKIKTPLMVVQGANDPRVHRREAEQVVVGLRNRNYPVEYILAPDEGHGFARPVNNMAMLAAAEKFLAKHLGGRYQESMTPEVAKRLSEITVNVKDVTVTKPADVPASSSRPAGAAPAAAVPTLTGVWSLVADASGQSIEVLMELRQDGTTFAGTTTAAIGSGTVSGGKLNGTTFTATLISDVQGQQVEFKMEGTWKGDTLTGTFTSPSLGSVPFTGTRAK